MNNLSLDIQQIFTQNGREVSNLHTALSSLLVNICEFTEWDYGEVWIPCQEDMLLELHSAFYITSHRSHAEVSSLEQFRICTKGFTFPLGVGLPGRVWSSRQSEWLPDASSLSERFFLRHQIAKAFGVKSGFGVPILANNCVLAILIFFMLHAREEDKRMTELVAALAMQIGNKLETFFREG